MFEEPLVSIVIPCRNGAACLGAAIESCLAQSWPNLEIIVVDNGSTDASLEVAKHYAGRSVVVLDCARPGASAARNVGLDRAAGDFIQFLDVDDLLDRDKIARQMARLSTAPAGSIASGPWARFRGDPAAARFIAAPVWRDLAPEEFLIASWLGGGMMPNFAWLTPRAAIDAAGRWDETLSLGDDGEFFCRVALASPGIVFCDAARGYYRTGVAGTLSRRRDPAALQSAYRVIELCCDRLLVRCASSDAARAACATQYQRFVYDVFPAAPDLVMRAEARVATLGGCGLAPGGGRAFRAIARWLGWKAARRCQLGWRGLALRMS